MKKIVAVLILILFSIAPASAYLRTDDSVDSGNMGTTVIKKPSGKFGGTEKITLTFTGFDGSAPVGVPLTLPSNLTGLISHAELYVSNADIEIDSYELQLMVRYSEPEYTDIECAAFQTAMGGSWTVEDYRQFTDEQRRQAQDCFYNHLAVDFLQISHALTTSLWINDWNAGTSGGTVDNSRVFQKSDRLKLTGPEFSEAVTVQDIDDATKTVDVSVLKNQYPIGTSVSNINPLQFTGKIGTDQTIPVSTYWILNRGEESSALSDSVTVKIDLYIY